MDKSGTNYIEVKTAEIHRDFTEDLNQPEVRDTMREVELNKGHEVNRPMTLGVPS